MRRALNAAVRPTVRLRLTLLFGALFLVAGAVLLGVTYGLLDRSLSAPLTPSSGKHDEEHHSDHKTNPSGPSIPTPQLSLDEQVEEARHEGQTAALQQFRMQAGLALLLTAAGALALGWLFAGRVLRPIQRITNYTRRASEATLGERIGLRGPPDELKELADTIDGMLDRLQAAFEAQRNFAAQASHELRTPLAIIRAEADVALTAPDATERERSLAAATLAAADRSERLVDGLLALARSESTLRDNVCLDLADVTGDIVGELVGAADAAGVTLDLALSPAAVSGDRALLERLVGNLVENAIRYNRSGGWVRVTVEAMNQEAVLRVVNSGPAVPTEVVSRLFAPFQRGPARGRNRPAGFGLGLAIVQAVAAVHGGSIGAKSMDAGGLEVTVRLPLVTVPEPSSGMASPVPVLPR